MSAYQKKALVIKPCTCRTLERLKKKYIERLQSSSVDLNTVGFNKCYNGALCWMVQHLHRYQRHYIALGEREKLARRHLGENLYQQIKFHYSHRQWEKCVRDKAATEQWTLRKPCSQSNTYHHCWWCAAAVSGSFGSAAPGPTTKNKTDQRSEISVLPRPALAFPPFLYRETALSDNRCPQHNTNTALREKSGGGGGSPGTVSSQCSSCE